MSITRFRVGLAAVFVIGIAALFIVFPALSQGPALPPGEYDLEAGQYVFNVPGVATQTEIPATPVPPTAVPPTDTPIAPTDTPVPESLPLCASHDSIGWHSLVAEDGSCHYNHTHEDNPADGDHIFGPLPFQEISYPWQTFRGAGEGYPTPPPPGSGDLENEFKHEGYKWDFEEKPECLNRDYYDTCVMAFRIERHALGGVHGATTRIHSYYAEVLVCTRDMATCGIVKMGGHTDYGCLQVWIGNDTEKIHLPLPGDPAECKNNPYTHHEMIGNEQNGGKLPGTNIDNVRYVWKSGGIQEGVHFAFTVHDDWQAIDANDPTREDLICPEFDCPFNHSLAATYVVSVPSGWLEQFDPDEDGIANFVGFVDRWGYVVEDCSPVGTDCVPVSVVNVPVGWAGYYENRHIGLLTEYDLSPPGEFWIEFPN